MSQETSLIECIQSRANIHVLHLLTTLIDQQTITATQTPVTLNALRTKTSTCANKCEGRTTPVERMQHCRQALQRLDTAGWKRSYHQRMFHDDFLVSLVNEERVVDIGCNLKSHIVNLDLPTLFLM